MSRIRNTDFKLTWVGGSSSSSSAAVAAAAVECLTDTAVVVAAALAADMVANGRDASLMSFTALA
jgi:hypothetical protein